MTAPYYQDSSTTVWAGDCLEILTRLDDSSVDAVVTDPPYGLSFMGRKWDSPAAMLGQLAEGHERRSAFAYGGTHSRGVADTDLLAFQDWCAAWAAQCLRILKPGGHLLAFGSPRTWHRLATGVEDAGFEFRDTIAWRYGQGFPKSRNLSGDHEGWGTGLKPAFEPIIVARRPLDGTVVQTVLTHGTGALHVDACRIPMTREDAATIDAKHAGMNPDTYRRAPRASLHLSTDPMPLKPVRAHDAGRWPTNTALDDAAASALDSQSGTSTSRTGRPRDADHGDGWGMTSTGTEHDDTGGASRFFPVFRWEPKAPPSERPSAGGVQHPTVKPLALMRWLIRMVVPHGGLVLAPFAGSGTTVEASLAEGMRCVAMERDKTYLPLIRERIDRARDVPMDLWGDGTT